MEPKVRPLLTVVEKNGKYFVSAEIPGVDLTERPCFYQGKGRVKGAYTRVGDSDEPMTEYEVYSYEAYRKKYQDDHSRCKQSIINIFESTAIRNIYQRLKGWKAKFFRDEHGGNL